MFYPDTSEMSFPCEALGGHLMLSVILGPPLLWESLTHGVRAVNPAGAHVGRFPCQLVCAEGPCHPLLPSGVLALRKEAFLCSMPADLGRGPVAPAIPRPLYE